MDTIEDRYTIRRVRPGYYKAMRLGHALAGTIERGGETGLWYWRRLTTGGDGGVRVGCCGTLRDARVRLLLAINRARLVPLATRRATPID